MCRWFSQREGLGFTLEPREAGGSESIREHLARDLAAEARVCGAIHGADATFANPGGYFVDPESCAETVARKEPPRVCPIGAIVAEDARIATAARRSLSARAAGACRAGGEARSQQKGN